MRDESEIPILPSPEQTLKGGGDEMRKARIGPLAERGVWVSPWLGPNGEMILVAVDRNHRRVGNEVVINPGMNHVLIADEMWERIEREDPQPNLRVV